MLRTRTSPQTQWNYPACPECLAYDIELVRTNAGAQLYEELQVLYPRRRPETLLKDLAAQLEARVVACEHLSAEGGMLQQLPAHERRAAGFRPSIRVWTRTKALYDEDGHLIATHAAWTDEGVYVQ